MNSNKFQVLESLDETEEFLSPMPDRIGHATFLHPDFGCSEDILERVLSGRIPIGDHFISSCQNS